MNIVVIDYGSGNLRSVGKALEKAAMDAGIASSITIADKSTSLAQADKIVLPGVGAFGDCLDGLRSLPGMQGALERCVKEKKKPFLGICVGMQLLADRGLENGEYNGLGWIPGEVLPLERGNPILKIPHMGWNVVKLLNGTTHPVISGFQEGTHAYFVHSYAFQCKNKEHILGTAKYGHEFPAIVGHENIIGTQFHPEKSQKAGLDLLRRFLRWNGERNNG